MLPQGDALVGQMNCPRCEAHLFYLCLAKGSYFTVQRPGESLQSFIDHAFPDAEGQELYQFWIDEHRDADSLDFVEATVEAEDYLRGRLDLSKLP